MFSINAVRLETGGRYALTGKNSAGKSTLLRILAGLETSGAGGVRYGSRGFDWNPYPDWLRRNVACAASDASCDSSIVGALVL